MKTNPNLIYILADDMGYGDVSCLNPRSAFRTPHLDRLADGGMRFTDAHSTSAVCTPSRYGILTGRYNWRSALKEGVTWGYSAPLLEAGRMTVASLLQRHGYTTAAIGKWHLGWEWARRGPGEEDVDFAQPIRRGPCSAGFDRFFGISASLDMPPYVYVDGDRVTAQPDRVSPGCDLPANRAAGDVGFRFWRPGPQGADFEHAAVLPTLTSRAVQFVEEQGKAGQPFFLYLPLPAPHTPILPSAAFAGRSGTNPYGDFCLMVDDVVGQVMAAVERAGQAENTIVVFTADNGCSPSADFPGLAKFGHHPSHVFRGHKADIYEGGHRIPLIARWPRAIRAGAVCDDTVCLVDLLATLAEIVGEKLPDNAGEDSVSNLPAWLERPGFASVCEANACLCSDALRPGTPGAAPVREATVHHSMDGSFSIRQGRWKLELCPGSGGWSWPRPGQECEGLPPIQLYDLSADIGERGNVQDRHPEIVQRLTDLLASYVRNGRSTPGAPQPNTGPRRWPQLSWMLAE